MKQVTLKSLTMEHFKSFGCETEVVFPTTPGMVMVAGDNRSEPRMGANGAGKSTLWDALAFCLFGSSVRGARGSDLITHDEKRCSVSVGFDIDGEAITLSRDGPPFHPKLSGSRVEQTEVDRLFGLSRPRFLSSVVFGQAVPLFIDLPVPERGDLLDEVLDLQLWMRAAGVASSQSSVLSREHDKLKVEVGRTEGALGALEDSAELQALSEKWSTDRQKAKRDLRLSIRELSKEVVSLQAELDRDLAADKVDSASLLAAYRECQQDESSLKSDLAVAENIVEMLKNEYQQLDAGVCIMCGQDVGEELAAHHEELHAAKLVDAVGQCEHVTEKWDVAHIATNAAQTAWQDSIKLERERDASTLRSKNKIAEKEAEARGLQGQLDRLSSEENPYVARLAKLREVKTELRSKLKTQKREEKTLITKLAQLDFWKAGFRRVRLFCMDRTLRELDLEVMNAARSLGLVGWDISHATEVETRSGTTRMGVRVQVASPTMSGSFVAWSGGEGQRIRLSSALGLAGMVQRWAGVRWNFEVFDEPTAWLSEAGIEDLLDLLRNRADLHNKVVFVSDHRGLQHAGFDKVMTVVKDVGGSRIL